MANGWKPKKGCKVSLNNVFSINYDQYVVDEIAKGLYKNKRKYREILAYLGSLWVTQDQEGTTLMSFIRVSLMIIPIRLIRN